MTIKKMWHKFRLQILSNIVDDCIDVDERSKLIAKMEHHEDSLHEIK